jgi:hypothetical protein
MTGVRRPPTRIEPTAAFQIRQPKIPYKASLSPNNSGKPEKPQSSESVNVQLIGEWNRGSTIEELLVGGPLLAQGADCIDQDATLPSADWRIQAGLREPRDN